MAGLRGCVFAACGRGFAAGRKLPVSNRILAELRAERDRIDQAISALEAVNSTGRRGVGRPPRAAEKPRGRGARRTGEDRRRPACVVGEGEAGPSVQAGAEDERRRPEEAVAAAEAALGAGKDEAEGEGEVGQAGGQVTGDPAGTLST